jgi:ubiquitin C-terminal hydrolase
VAAGDGGACIVTDAELAAYRAAKAELAQCTKSEGSAFFLTRGPAVGLVNQGATCYMNSLLQSLFWTTEFRSLLYKVRGARASGRRRPVLVCTLAG